MFFYDFFYSEINPVYYFYWKIITFTQICSGFFIIVNNFFYYLLLQVFRCRIKQKSIQPLFRHKNPQNQYMSQKNTVCTQGLVGLLTSYVCSTRLVRKTHWPSARASSPTTCTANSTLGLKRPTLRPRYTINYLDFFVYILLFY